MKDDVIKYALSGMTYHVAKGDSGEYSVVCVETEIGGLIVVDGASPYEETSKEALLSFISRELDEAAEYDKVEWRPVQGPPVRKERESTTALASAMEMQMYHGNSPVAMLGNLESILILDEDQYDYIYPEGHNPPYDDEACPHCGYDGLYC